MAWVLYVLVTGTLLAAAALAIDALLRRTSLPTRWLWVATLAGIVALAVVAPRRNAPASQQGATVLVSGTRLDQRMKYEPTLLQRAGMVRDEAAAVVTAAVIDVEHRTEALIAPLALAWLVASGIMLSLLVIVTRRTDHVRIRWPRAAVRGVDVRVSPSTGPAVMGVARPDIVVPSWLMARTEDEQHLVVVHEREHVDAHDQLLPLAAWIVVALLPWHPAVWFAMSRLRLAIELDCDARVLNRGIQPRSYGTLLIDIAGQCAGHRMGALALADRPSHLERRLLAMKSPRRIGFARLTSLTGVAALAIAMACEARIPTAAEMNNMDVATLEKTATQAKLLEVRPDSVTYYVNEMKLSGAEAKKIKGSLIATMNVSKTATGSEVRITTNDMLPSKMRADSLAPTVREFRVVPDAFDAGGVRVKGVLLNKTVADAPMVVIDGRTSDMVGLKSMSPNSVETINVLKGAAATQAYGAAAANGVIVVTTKR